MPHENSFETVRRINPADEAHMFKSAEHKTITELFGLATRRAEESLR